MANRLKYQILSPISILLEVRVFMLGVTVRNAIPESRNAAAAASSTRYMRFGNTVPGECRCRIGSALASWSNVNCNNAHKGRNKGIVDCRPQEQNYIGLPQLLVAELEHGLHCLPAVCVLALLRHKAVRFINEQHAVECFVDFRVRLQSGLASSRAVIIQRRRCKVEQPDLLLLKRRLVKLVQILP